ncbi:MAG: tetratricopeptide repeat protein [Sulfurovum sp.]|jgi:TPR repeat protein|uniref:tetratricopeptide repeat protein n=1 Tax=Sulfurovum sp. TaxID=1969726 RepID=UPI003C73DFBF
MKYLFIFIIATLSLFANEFNQAVEDYNNGGYIKALNTFYSLAKKGDAKAQFNVGLIYANGKGVQKDLTKARKWYEKAAKQDNGPAQYNLAQLYHAAGESDPHGYEKARYWYEKAVEAGIMQAYNNLAALYIEGKGVQKDQQKAFELFQEAAKKGDPSAQVNVAVLYAWGEDITHDKMKAYDNFKKALIAGKSEASGYLDKLCKESAWVCQD